ncbi:MAG TPA: GNAT family N-acetyltransferase [Candidatus Angelobacter sp.]|nr:GNAT family N-acetyltransferase [Candidatus Angelobacter sp.]
MDDLEILPLTPDRLSDLAQLFGQGGDPKRCWCSWYRLRNADFIGASAESNRGVLEQAVATTAAEGRAPGLVAYREAEPIGWVSVGPRADYARLDASRVLAPIDDRPTWSIVCFVVARKARGQGVANALLDAAVAYAAEHGATLVEAYPADTHGDRISPAAAYKGTVRMFERAGFEVAARRRATRASPERPILRRDI